MSEVVEISLNLEEFMNIGNCVMDYLSTGIVSEKDFDKVDIKISSDGKMSIYSPSSLKSF